MEIYDSILNINEMTRPNEKRKYTHNVVICDVRCKNIFEVMEKIKSIEKQDENYLSYNYVIESSGKIFKLIPDEEVSYFSNSIDLDLESISIGVCFKEEEKNNIWKESLSFLIKKICSKYHLKSKDVRIEYDVFNTRNFGYFIDNYYYFEDIIKN